ncbi:MULTISPECIES: helix-turn-helix domain-containing protein [Actinoalloteichus]|uniref:Transcriptional regulator, XRE family n=1 Tax=Actinoalloteichus fjordicus TaxID=1612552 RepID=A0AAC9PQT8_9PSEU|nr:MULTISPECIES: helix-turn-helix transcriptional regulator [Actinoalloteichus]APU13267.1 transcriptional regulator, XRE family [Actinoalloteichus fjordicus]APU19218.1 transcriptional regulator, XRE family [Actinoalloteichus sp. GBA129-24]
MASKALARAIGAELRELRKKHSLTLAEVGRAIGYSPTTMSHTETGKRLASPEDVASILTVFSVTGRERERIVQMARDALQPRWLEVGIDGLLPQITAMAEFESTAERITTVTPLLVPGLLQTADYARAIMRGARVPKSQVEGRVALRMGRQAILDRTAITYHAIIDEGVLLRRLGGFEVMAAQLQHLLTMADRPNITIQVVRLDVEWHDGLEGSFVVLEFPKTHPVVHLEHRASGLFLDEDDAEDVAEYIEAAAKVRDVALSATASAELIRHRLTEMEHGHDDGTPHGVA